VDKFESDVDDIIRACRATTTPGADGVVRGFGELICLVWNVNLGATISLEQMRYRIIDRHKASLMCTYELKGRRDIPKSIRSLHSHPMDDATVKA
jgi:hypothetical protein